MAICEYELCSGCGACLKVCPFDAINMQADSEGFLRPFTDEEKCVDCGLCRKKCPVNKTNKEDKVNEPCSYAAYSLDPAIRKHSSSGGVFAHLAAEVLDRGGVVCGAAFDKDMRVIHKIAKDRDELFHLMGSKYVQSDVTQSYPEMEEYLNKGKTVLFAGTPCQCAGVKSAFGSYDGLVLVDIICHGVPTPRVFEMYLKENFENVRNVSFRDKKHGWDEFSMRVDLDKGEYRATRYKDPYIRMFFENVNLRPSCYKCSWKGEGFVSDITLGDYWGVTKNHPHMNDDRGTSLVVVRSEKGRELFLSVGKALKVCKTDLKRAVESNAMYYKSTPRPSKRDAFFEGLKNGETFEELNGRFGLPVPFKKVMVLRTKNIIKLVMGKFTAIIKK